MKKFISYVISYVICFSLILGAPTMAYAGDIVEAGTTLEERSYVFTVDEATRLLQRVEVLEAKELELDRYVQLEAIRAEQINLYELNLSYSRTQLQYYSDLSVVNQNLIDKYHKRQRFNELENIGFLALGMALTVGAFLAADAITDQMETNSAASVSF